VARDRASMRSRALRVVMSRRQGRAQIALRLRGRVALAADRLRPRPYRQSARLHVCRWTFFFFSSRRRHTRLVSDWSSDVCSSDLFQVESPVADSAPARTVQINMIDEAPDGRRAVRPVAVDVIERFAGVETM